QLRVRRHHAGAAGRVRRLRRARDVDRVLDDGGGAVVRRVAAAGVDEERRGGADRSRPPPRWWLRAPPRLPPAPLRVVGRRLRLAARHARRRVAAGSGGVDLLRVAPARPAERERSEKRRAVARVLDDGGGTPDEAAVRLLLARAIEGRAGTAAGD